MKVVFLNRKPIPGKYFSIENLFKIILNAMPSGVECEVREMKYFSKGFLRRLYIAFDAALHQGEVNHITGDIHFVAVFLKKKRTILTVHDVGFMREGSLLRRLILKWCWIVFPVRRSSVVTTVSTATKMELLKYVRVKPSRIRVVYDTFDPGFVPWPKTFNKDEPTILQIGTTSNKNIPRLLEAITGMACKLEIIGVLKEDIIKELESRKIKYSIYSNLSQDQMIERYRQADVISFVSTYEGFGLPIVESNATGRVVVTSNILSMPEIGNDAVHFVDPFDVSSIRAGIFKVIENDCYRESLIEKGFENIRRFNATGIAIQYAQLYYDLVRKR